MSLEEFINWPESLVARGTHEWVELDPGHCRLIRKQEKKMLSDEEINNLPEEVRDLYFRWMGPRYIADRMDLAAGIQVMRQLASAIAEAARYREVLSFYADEKNHLCNGLSKVDGDLGERARKALEVKP